MSTSLWTAHGRTKESIDTIIAALVTLNPLWIWLEPRPGCGLDANGKPIAQIAPTALHPLLMPAAAITTFDKRLVWDEARLFWPEASLHLLAEHTETRWFYWAEESGLSDETRCGISKLGALNEPTTALACDSVTTALTRRDFERFGLKRLEAQLPQSLRLKIYRADANIVAWTITTNESL